MTFTIRNLLDDMAVEGLVVTAVDVSALAEAKAPARAPRDPRPADEPVEPPPPDGTARRRPRHVPELPITVVFIDLDGFKAINDRFGHRAGDSVLAEAARRIRSAAVSADTVARLGGDEFVIVFRDPAPKEIERVGRTLRDPIPLAGGRTRRPRGEHGRRHPAPGGRRPTRSWPAPIRPCTATSATGRAPRRASLGSPHRSVASGCADPPSGFAAPNEHHRCRMPVWRLLLVHSTGGRPARRRRGAAAAPRTPPASRAGRGSRRGSSGCRGRRRGAGSGRGGCRTRRAGRRPARRGWPSPPTRAPCRPARASWPPSATGLVTVRRFDGEGVVHRSISSMAGASSAGSASSGVALVGVVEEREQAAGDGVAGRLRARREQQREEGVQLHVGEAWRIGVLQLGVHDDREHVVGRVLPLRGDQRAAVLEHAGLVGRAARRRTKPASPSRMSKPGSTARQSSWRSASGTPSRMQMACMGSSAATVSRKSTGSRRRRCRRAAPGCAAGARPRAAGRCAA